MISSFLIDKRRIALLRLSPNYALKFYAQAFSFTSLDKLIQSNLCELNF